MIPDNAITLAKLFEGYSSRVYYCPAGYPTIGYGHVCDPKHAPITREQGEAYLMADMMKAFKSTLRLCPILSGHPDKLGAITDFVFNLGAGRLQASTLRRFINRGDWEESARQLNKWVYGGGRKLKGLIHRRAAEAIYFQS